VNKDITKIVKELEKTEPCTCDDRQEQNITGHTVSCRISILALREMGSSEIPDIQSPININKGRGVVLHEQIISRELRSPFDSIAPSPLSHGFGNIINSGNYRRRD